MSEANRRKCKVYHLRRHQMGGSTLVDAEPSAVILRDLITRMSKSAIAARLDTSHNYVTSVANGDVRRISPQRAAAIAAIGNYRPTDNSHVNATGARRRLQALHAIGYTWQRLSEEIEGYSLGCIKDLVSEKWAVLEGANDKAIRDAYERLSMVLPTSDDRYVRSAIGSARNSARRKGWAPPLAWDDIDNDEAPDLGGVDEDIDPVVVMRLLEGQRIESTRAEKIAALERWVRDGGTERELCAWHGWKAGRYSAGLRMVKGGAA